jgi:A/G-specific adenine glycosylase
MISVSASISKNLLGWYDKSRRDLPWRASPHRRPDPYRVLVSEAMLQQTQVKTVISYFQRFMQSFPTIAALARAREQRVLRLWQGLGYYSRARNLRRAAQVIVSQYDGIVPPDVDSLLKLPGVGRYTAGAIASLAYDVPAPIVDGNVTRVICRLDAIHTPPSDLATRKVLWQRAAELVPRRRAGDFNSAMMELGATVCTARSPRCEVCPIRIHCRAHQLKIQNCIPAAKAAKKVPLVIRHTCCLRRGINGCTEWLIEQRPNRGRWAGMWQFITTHSAAQVPAPNQSLGTIKHSLSHRHYRFHVYLCDVDGKSDEMGQTRGRRWVSLRDLRRYPLPQPHVLIADILRNV